MHMNGNQNDFNMFLINNNSKSQTNLQKPNQIEEKSPINNISFQNSKPGFDNSFNSSNYSQPKLVIKQQVFHPMVSDQMNYQNNINETNSNVDEDKQLQKKSNISQIQNNIQYSHIKLNKMVILNSLSDQKTVFIVQKILQESSNEDVISIVHELKGEYRKLIYDKYGNFFCKDLFKIINTIERIEILKELHPTLSEDCCHSYATHPLQALVEFSSTEEEYKLILFSFNDYNKLLFATIDPNGSYVIQKIIDRIPERFRKDFNYIFSSFIGFVCKKKYGIVALKKFIECTRSEAVMPDIIKLIRDNFMNFAVDKYGNYLIQYILDKFANFSEGKEIKILIFNNFNVMCKSKYSSFICESYVKTLNNDEKIQLIKTLDINSIIKSNNPNSVKILKSLGINMNIINAQNNIHLPLSLNNNMNNNNLNSNFTNYDFGYKGGKYN